MIHLPMRTSSRETGLSPAASAKDQVRRECKAPRHLLTRVPRVEAGGWRQVVRSAWGRPLTVQEVGKQSKTLQRHNRARCCVPDLLDLLLELLHDEPQDLRDGHDLTGKCGAVPSKVSYGRLGHGWCLTGSRARSVVATRPFQRPPPQSRGRGAAGTQRTHAPKKSVPMW